jgi:hypothetical protein
MAVFNSECLAEVGIGGGFDEIYTSSTLKKIAASFDKLLNKI